VGNTATFAVTATGSMPMSYQWNLNSTNLAGATNSTLTQVFQATNAGSYSVSVANSYGTVKSGAAAISVAPVNAPTVLQGPVSRTLYPGATLALSVTASGGALYYQWQVAGTNIPGATASSYQVTNVTAAAAGTYSGFVSNRIGATPFGPATITIPTPSKGSYEAVITADKPEAWWRLDEAPGATNMWDSMGRHDGYYTNVSGNPAKLGVPGALISDPDTAVSFDGTSASYGVAPYSPAINTETFTLECWVNSSSASNFGVPVSDQFGLKGFFFTPSGPDPNFASGWALLVDSGGQTFGVPSTAAPNAISQGWTHLAVSYGSAAGMRYFINGQWDGASYVDFDRNNAGPLIIGALGEASGAPPDTFFEGQVDEVAVYTTDLSSNQIQAHYQGRYGVNNKPIFLGSLVSQVVPAGTPVSFSTIVAGSLPIGLQWEKNGAPIAGATTSTLTLTNTVLSDTATYQLVASNSAGSTNSSVSLVVVPPPTFANVTNNLLLHLKFNGNYIDASGRGNNGTPMGGPTFVPGKIGSQALHYSTTTTTLGSGGTVTNASYVTLGAPAGLNLGSNWANGLSFSVAFWIRLPAGYAGGDLPFFSNAIDSNNDLGFTFSPSYDLGGWQWCLDDVAKTGAGDFDINGPNNSINDGNWHHLAVAFDSAAGLGTTYLDGVQVQTSPLTGLGDFDSGNSVTIGQDPTGAYNESGSADIDDLGVWQAVLTPLDVCIIYGAGANAGVSFDTVGQPKLGFLRSGNNLLFIWQGGTLLQAPSLKGPWSAVSGAAAPTATVTPGPGNKFYRIEM